MPELLLLSDILSQAFVFSFKLLIVRNYSLDFNIDFTNGFLGASYLDFDSLSLLIYFNRLSLLVVIEIPEHVEFVLQR